MVAKIRKSDMVKILAGKEKGKVGVVLSVINEGKSVIVEGLNTVKRSVRRNPQTGEEGGYRTKEMPIDISNVAFYDDSKNEIVKIGVKLLSDGKKIRYNKASGKNLDTDDKK